MCELLMPSTTEHYYRVLGTTYITGTTRTQLLVCMRNPAGSVKSTTCLQQLKIHLCADLTA